MLKYIFKRIPAVFFIAMLLVFASCGTEKMLPEIDAPDGIADSIADSMADGMAENTALTIVWDVLWNTNDLPMLDLADSKITNALNERFNITMDSKKFTGGDKEAFWEKLIAEDALPDIFMYPEGFVQLVEAGKIREIPWETLERHAPRYAALINVNEPLKEMLTENPIGKYLLPGMQKENEMLGIFSVYRLDWLEYIGITPHGNIDELDERVYFTENAFTMHEFAEILHNFVSQSTEEYAMRGMTAAGNRADWYMTAPLLGMWGLGFDFYNNINAGGKAVYGFSGDGFRSYVLLMEQLLYAGALTVDSSHTFGGAIKEDGWWAGDLHFLLGEQGSLKAYTAAFPKAKLLVTPPEIGPGGMQGSYSFYNPHNSFTTLGNNYLIAGHVDDEKLARILTILEAITFEPELYIMTHFGFEGEDFTWSGQPYDSGVIRYRESMEPTGLFVTNVLDGTAGRHIYRFPSEKLYRFASDESGRAMMLHPYKTDPFGESREELMELMAQYPEGDLSNISAAYYQAVMTGERDAASAWDEYIIELENNGLHEWNAFYDSLTAW